MLNNLSDRKSIRLLGYDYSQSGHYFITICTQNRTNMFGEIINSVGADPCVRPSLNKTNTTFMELNECGNMVNVWWNIIPNKFNVILDIIQIMPNHIHMIIRITSTKDGRTHGSAPTKSSTTIGMVIQWFKTMVTNEYMQNVHQNKWKSFDKRLFQRNYYEHIIRTEEEYFKIRQYITLNPSQWDTDRNNPKSADYGNIIFSSARS